jgi:hypothetical protein
MSQKTSWRGVLVGLLCVALATPVGAQNGSGKGLISYKGSDNTAAKSGAAAGVVGAAAIITLVLTHKKQITGCVTANDKGMDITDEHNKQTYELLGSRAYLKPGERVRLQIKKINLKEKGRAPIWEVQKLIKDYGACG